MRSRLWIACAVAVLVGLPTFVLAESAQQAFSRGKDLLAQGNAEGALSAFAAAARADLDNDAYRQQYALVRRIVDLRKVLGSEQDLERWEYTARALHAFYLDQGLHSQAVEVARKMHERVGSAASGLLLAETELALNNNAEAEKMLSALDREGKSTPSTQALWCVALARLGKAAQAKEIAQRVALPEDAGPQVTYSVARLRAATGNGEAALAALEKCFESLPASRLENFKQHAKLCPDFTALASTVQFAKVLKTESKVAESKCSGGSGCAGCPMRGKCAKAAAQE